MAVTEMGNAAIQGVGGTDRLRIWSWLDRLYWLAGYLAAFCMVMIFALTMLQIVSRYLGYNIPGLPNYVGYLTGASTFLALAHTLNKGVHVRVELFMAMLGRWRVVSEVVGMLFSAAVGSWFAYYCWRTVLDSYNFGDLSDGLDATPLWIPQISMAIGATLLAVAVIDHFMRLLIMGDHEIESADEPL